MQPTVLDQGPANRIMLADVLHGLSRRPKRLPSRYLYDERGSRLFERICRLDEYYLTRIELEILHGAMTEIAGHLGRRTLVFEPGSGAGRKTRLLLAALDRPAAYVPIDISREQLIKSAEALAGEFPGLEVLPVCADFTSAFDLPPVAHRVDRRCAFFPGSTIGNFTPTQSVRLLSRLRVRSGRDGFVLVGVDLKKDRAVLEPAYDDAKGVSAAFGMNYLVRLNRELQANFDLDRFCYSAPYNARLDRMEMYLVSVCDQTVRVAGHPIGFRAGERVRTEVSYKYPPQQFALLARRAGLEVVQMWVDSRNYFSVQLLRSKKA